MASDINRILDAAKAQGWRVERTAKGHYKLLPPDGGPPVYTAGTPSDWRSWKNFQAKLKRRGVTFDGITDVGSWPTWGKVLGAVALWETFWWLRRRHVRKASYLYALHLARSIGKPLVVVGAPDMGMTEGPGCGDITIDIGKSACPNFIQADITKKIPLGDDSGVVLVLCTLEYVGDYDAAMRELKRVAGKNLFVVRVEPWTLAAYLYPGRKRILPVK